MRTCSKCSGRSPDEAVFCPRCGARFVMGPPPKTEQSFKIVLLVIFVVAIPVFVGIVGIIAAIAIPNLLDAIERSKQKRTVSDIRMMTAALQTYTRDYMQIPMVDPPVLAEDWQFFPATDLEAVLTPDYISAVPAVDGWENPLEVGFRETPTGLQYCIVSPGSNGEMESTEISVDLGEQTHCYESDIIAIGDEESSTFMKMPDGRQRKCGSDVVLREAGGS